MRSRSLHMIVAATNNGGIGYKGKLPFRIAKEMAYFKKTTLDTGSEDVNKRNAVIMGRKTWESIPRKFRPLPNRLNIVLTRNPKSETAAAIRLQDAGAGNAMVCHSLEDALRRLSWPPFADSIEKVFAIGGAQVYNEALKSKALDRVYLTRIDAQLNCDTFVEIDDENLTLLSESDEHIADDDSNPGLKYKFLVFQKPPEKTEEEKKSEEIASADAKSYASSKKAHAIDGSVVVATESESDSKSAAERRDADIGTGNAEEMQYLDLIQKIIDGGYARGDRTGTGTLALFGTTMRFSLRGGRFPLLTTKRVFWRGVAEELLWFIAGSTDAKVLSAKRIKIWDGNGSREFLDKRGLSHYVEGDLGPVYGFQWRHFGAEYKGKDADYSGQGVDQLANVIEMIRSNPNSRRIVMSAWNPADLPKMALPPCHMFCQFFVANGELSAQMYQRSADMGLGVPFNIASYALLTCLLAQVCGLKPGDFVHCIGDTHVYSNHVEALKLQLKRAPRDFPTLELNPNRTQIDDFQYSDLKITGYKPHPRIAMKMAV